MSAFSRQSSETVKRLMTLPSDRWRSGRTHRLASMNSAWPLCSVATALLKAKPDMMMVDLEMAAMSSSNLALKAFFCQVDRQNSSS